MYTLTLAHTDDDANPTGETTVYSGLTLAEAKAIAKRNCSSVATWTKEKAVKVAVKPLTFFYRGEQVEIVEEVTNGYTLVNFSDGSRFFFHANTVEIEAR